MLYQPLILFDLITFSGNWFRWHMIYVTHRRHFKRGCSNLRPWSRMQQHFETHGCCCCCRTFPTCFLNQQLFCICCWCCCCCCWCCLVVSYDISSLFSQSTAVLHVFYSVIVVVVVGNVNVVKVMATGVSNLFSLHSYSTSVKTNQIPFATLKFWPWNSIHRLQVVNRGSSFTLNWNNSGSKPWNLIWENKSKVYWKNTKYTSSCA